MSFVVVDLCFVGGGCSIIVVVVVAAVVVVSYVAVYWCFRNFLSTKRSKNRMNNTPFVYFIV